MSKIKRETEARKIFSKYLSDDATDPVNVDSKARNLTQQLLDSADPNLFVEAQKQIFDLMKYDCFPRFVKSDEYKKYIKKEKSNDSKVMNQEKCDSNQCLSLNSMSSHKLKKSLSNADDRRRKSLLTWSRKSRYSSKDLLERHPSEKLNDNYISSLSSMDISSLKKKCMLAENLPTKSEASIQLCRIHFPDASSTVTQVKDEPVHSFMSRQLEKRGLQLSYFEVFENSCSSKVCYMLMLNSSYISYLTPYIFYWHLNCLSPISTSIKSL